MHRSCISRRTNIQSCVTCTRYTTCRASTKSQSAMRSQTLVAVVESTADQNTLDLVAFLAHFPNTWHRRPCIAESCCTSCIAGFQAWNLPRSLFTVAAIQFLVNLVAISFGVHSFCVFHPIHCAHWVFCVMVANCCHKHHAEGSKQLQSQRSSNSPPSKWKIDNIINLTIPSQKTSETSSISMSSQRVRNVQPIDQNNSKYQKRCLGFLHYKTLKLRQLVKRFSFNWRIITFHRSDLNELFVWNLLMWFEIVTVLEARPSTCERFCKIERSHNALHCLREVIFFLFYTLL